VVRAFLAAALAGVLLAGCGGSAGSGAASSAPAPVPAPAPSPASSPPPGEPPPPTAPQPSGSGGTSSYEVWFVRDGKLFSAGRTGEATQAVATRALQAVGAGPSSAESGAGVKSAIVGGPQLALKGISNGIATVDTPAGFRSGAAAERRVREAQVVYTLTQYPTIRRVLFSGTTTPVSRKDFEDLVPPITVASPAIGQKVSSPLRISGTADTFEATVSMRILDAHGNELAKGFTTATCGSGCRGDYTTSLRYSAPADEPGVVEVYEDSAENGQRIHVVDVPVTLTTSR
jgi:hypothetical protein